jgi:hypothetical protein
MNLQVKILEKVREWYTAVLFPGGECFIAIWVCVFFFFTFEVFV